MDHCFREMGAIWWFLSQDLEKLWLFVQWYNAVELADTSSWATFLRKDQIAEFAPFRDRLLASTGSSTLFSSHWYCCYTSIVGPNSLISPTLVDVLCRLFDSNLSQSCVVNDQHHSGRQQSIGSPSLLHHADCYGCNSNCSSQVMTAWCGIYVWIMLPLPSFPFQYPVFAVLYPLSPVSSLQSSVLSPPSSILSFVFFSDPFDPIVCRFLNRAMKSFDATVVVPTNFVLFTISAIISGKNHYASIFYAILFSNSLLHCSAETGTGYFI